MMRISIQFKCSWSPERQQVCLLAPTTYPAILINWTIEPFPIDSGVPDLIKRVIASVMTSVGQMAFRWKGDVPCTGDYTIFRRKPVDGIKQSVFEIIFRKYIPNIVLTRSADVTTLMFEHEWEMQGQVGLLIASTGELDEALQSDLMVRSCWNSFNFPSPTKALLVPSVDGYGALLSAVSSEELQLLVGALKAAFKREDIQVEGS